MKLQGILNLKEINVLGKTYKIIYKDELEEDGEHIPFQREILVNNKLKEFDRCEILFHEIIHAVESILDLGLKEKQVVGLSVGLFDCLTRNKIIEP